MVDVDAPSPDQLTCWQCGAPALAHCASRVMLIALARHELNSLGHAVKRGRIQDTLTIIVPRCTSCRDQRRLEFAIIVGGLLVGAVMGQIVIPLVWPALGVVPPLDLSTERRGSTAQAIGAAAGLVGALLVTTLHRRTQGLRRIYAYPAIVKARAIGWKFSGGSG